MGLLEEQLKHTSKEVKLKMCLNIEDEDDNEEPADMEEADQKLEKAKDRLCNATKQNKDCCDIQ